MGAVETSTAVVNSERGRGIQWRSVRPFRGCCKMYGMFFYLGAVIPLRLQYQTLKTAPVEYIQGKSGGACFLWQSRFCFLLRFLTDSTRPCSISRTCNTNCSARAAPTAGSMDSSTSQSRFHGEVLLCPVKFPLLPPSHDDT